MTVPPPLVEVSEPAHVATNAYRVQSAGRERLAYALEAYALVILLVAVIIFFSVWPATSDVFPTTANFQLVLGGQAVLAIIAIGALIPLICTEWDLSVGASAGLSAVVSASQFSNGTTPALAVLIGIFTGVGIGLLNAVLVTKLGTNAVITTLGTAAIVAGAINQITGGSTKVSDIPDALTSFGSSPFLGLPKLFYVLVAVAGIAYYVLEHTPFGRQLYAIGSNRNAARLVGLRTKWTIGLTFVIAGGLSGLAGLLQVARSGAADPRLGDSLTLPALAAAFLSAAAIRPGRYNVGGTLVALFLLAFLNSGLTIAGVPPYVSQYVNGAALVIGVGLAVNLGRKRASN